MNRRTFTLAGFFGTIGSALGTVFGKTQGYDSPPAPIPSAWTSESQVNLRGYLSDHTIKVGRKIMRVNPEGAWEVYADTTETIARSNEAADVMESLDYDVWTSMSEDYRSVSAPPRPRQRLTLPPEDIKHWSAVPDVLKPAYSGSFQAKISELHTLLERLESLTHSTPWETPAREMRARIFELEQDIRRAIKVRATMCDGHNGPTPLGEMTDMPDGRRLCPYCYKQETERDVQHDGSDRGQAPSA